MRYNGSPKYLRNKANEKNETSLKKTGHHKGLSIPGSGFDKQHSQ